MIEYLYNDALFTPFASVEEDRLKSSFRNPLKGEPGGRHEAAREQVKGQSETFNALSCIWNTVIYELIEGDIYRANHEYSWGDDAVESEVLSGTNEGALRQKVKLVHGQTAGRWLAVFGFLGVVTLAGIEAVNLLKLAISPFTVLPYLIKEHGFKVGLKKMGQFLVKQLDVLIATLLSMVLLMTIVPIAGLMSFLPRAKAKAQHNVDEFNRNDSRVQKLLDAIESEELDTVQQTLQVIWNEKTFTIEQKKRYFEAALKKAKDKRDVLLILIDPKKIEQSESDNSLEKDLSSYSFILANEIEVPKAQIHSLLESVTVDARFCDKLFPEPCFDDQPKEDMIELIHGATPDIAKQAHDTVWSNDSLSMKRKGNYLQAALKFVKDNDDMLSKLIKVTSIDLSNAESIERACIIIVFLVTHKKNSINTYDLSFLESLCVAPRLYEYVFNPLEYWNNEENTKQIIQIINQSTADVVRQASNIVWNHKGIELWHKGKYFQYALESAKDNPAVLSELIDITSIDLSNAESIERAHLILLFLMEHKYHSKKSHILAISKKICGDQRYNEYVSSQASSKDMVMRLFYEKIDEVQAEDSEDKQIQAQLLLVDEYFVSSMYLRYHKTNEVLSAAIDDYLQQFESHQIDLQDKSQVQRGWYVIYHLINSNSFCYPKEDLDEPLRKVNLLLSHEAFATNNFVPPEGYSTVIHGCDPFRRACALGYINIVPWLFHLMYTDTREDVLAKDDYKIFRDACNSHQDIAQFLLQYPSVRRFAQASTDDAIQRAYQSYMYHSTMSLTAFASASFFKDENSPAHVLSKDVLSVIAGFVNGV